MPDVEVLFLVEEPGADRRYVWRTKPDERQMAAIKSRGGKVYQVMVHLPTKMETLLPQPPLTTWAAPQDD
jgi:hypothetical protein